MRNAFVDELCQAARQKTDIALIVGDLGYKVIEPFADEFPERFFNAGVAEQNMMGMAAGMASEGIHTFVYSIANFPTFRCAEQLRNDVAYQNLPVTVVSVGGGLAYGALGYSHHAVQDYALMRCMPNMLIAAPGDPLEVRACMRYLVSNPGPSYLRLGKAGEPDYRLQIPDVYPGALNLLQGNLAHTKAILSTGTALGAAIEWRERTYCEHSVFTVPLWSMNSKRLIADRLSGFNEIISTEDHLLDCGFGSYLLEARNLLELPGTKIEVIALAGEVCGEVGGEITLQRLGGLRQ